MSQTLLNEHLILLREVNTKLEERIKALEIENAFLKQSPGRKATKKKRTKPKTRQEVRHLKLIAVNGVPVPAKD